MLRVGTIVAVLLALCVPGSALAKAHRADGKLSDWRGKPTNIAGQATTSRGEYVYTDWVYDDHGPDLDGAPNETQYRGLFASVLGDYEYPDDPARYGYDAADLREVRVAADRRGLHFLIALQTMKVRDAAIVEIGLDADRSTATSTGSWPAGAGLRSRGAERFVTAWGKGARFTGPSGRTRKLRAAVNLSANTIEVDAPFKKIGRRFKRHPRIWVAAGLNDGNGRFRQVESGATAAFNVGYRSETQPRFLSNWNEQRQSTVLASGDVTAFAGSFDLRRLKAGRSVARRPLKPGFYNRLFRSRKSYGEGVALKASDPAHAKVGGSPDPEFKSRWQPYGLYIPKGWNPKRRTPLTLDGHSLDCNQNQYANISPRQLSQLGDARGSILFTPLARGADTWYLDSGLVDTLEAWRDVRRHYRVDPERTAIMGYSMGGYMTYRLGLLMPDRFSRASVYVGPPAYQFWPYPGSIQPGDPKWTVPGNTNQIVENAYDLPYEMISGNADELVPINGVQHQVDTFKADGNDYRFFRHSADDHISFSIADEWARTRDWLGTFKRDRNPITVRYRRYPSMDLPKDGLRFDRAYWVSGIRVRSARSLSSSGVVHATTYGFGGNRKKAQLSPPGFVSGPTTPGTVTRQRQVAGAPIARSNGFEASLRNLESVRFDLVRMGLRAKRRLKLHVVSDGPAKVTLLGRFGHGRKRKTISVRAGTTNRTLVP